MTSSTTPTPTKNDDKNVNKTLMFIVGSLSAVVVLLIGGVSGASIAVAHLTTSNQLAEVDAHTGIMYSKESNEDHSHVTTMKTEDVVIYSDTTNIVDMTNDELMNLKEILLTDGDVKFQIKGYARSKDNSQIGLLVQGGTIIYDNQGLASATGDAKVLLELAYGTVVVENDEDDGFRLRGRKLPSGCSNDDTQTGSGTSNSNRNFY